MLDDLVARDPTPGSAVMVPMAALSTGEALGMWIMGGVFERFPGLKVVFVEPGLGWIAWWLFITDDMVTRQGYDLPAITELPSFYFHRNVFVTFIDETDAVTAPQLRNRIGIENMMWSSDYPHPVTSWPNSRRVVAETLGGAHPRPSGSWSWPATHGASGTCEDGGMTAVSVTAAPNLWDPDVFTGGPPHEFLAELRRTQPVYWQDMPDEPGFWAVLTHADLTAVAREPVLYSASEGGVVLENLDPENLEQMRGMLLAMDPPEARRVPAPARAELQGPGDRRARGPHPHHLPGDQRHRARKPVRSTSCTTSPRCCRARWWVS